MTFKERLRRMARANDKYIQHYVQVMKRVQHLNHQASCVALSMTEIAIQMPINNTTKQIVLTEDNIDTILGKDATEFRKFIDTHGVALLS